MVGGAVPEVLGTTALQLVGQKISIDNSTFEVVGALEPKGGTGWFNQDEQIFVPVNTAQFRLIGTDRIGSFNVTMREGASTTLAMAQIEAIMRREHRLRVGEANDFWVMDRAELMGTRQETTQTFTYLLAGIALVSLLVGGIGIMNIMLVSVTERTREIGIRMALGATRAAVLTQFLLEALALCLVGGLIGIALGNRRFPVAQQPGQLEYHSLRQCSGHGRRLLIEYRPVLRDLARTQGSKSRSYRRTALRVGRWDESRSDLLAPARFPGLVLWHLRHARRECGRIAEFGPPDFPSVLDRSPGRSARGLRLDS